MRSGSRNGVLDQPPARLSPHRVRPRRGQAGTRSCVAALVRGYVGRSHRTGHLPLARYTTAGAARRRAARSGNEPGDSPTQSAHARIAWTDPDTGAPARGADAPLDRLARRVTGTAGGIARTAV